MKSWRRISKSKFSWRPSGTKSDDGDEVSLSAAAATALEDHSEEGAVDDLLIAVSSASRHLTAFENGLFYGILGLRCFVSDRPGLQPVNLNNHSYRFRHKQWPLARVSLFRILRTHRHARFYQRISEASLSCVS